MKRAELLARFTDHSPGAPVSWTRGPGGLVVVWCGIWSPDEHLTCDIVVAAASRKEAVVALRSLGVHQVKPGEPKPVRLLPQPAGRLAVAAPGRVVASIRGEEAHAEYVDDAS